MRVYKHILNENTNAYRAPCEGCKYSDMQHSDRVTAESFNYMLNKMS